MNDKRNGTLIGSAIAAEPTIDPDACACANCVHAFMQRLPPPSIQVVRICKRLPPTPLALRDRNGAITGFASTSPIVLDSEFCGEFAKREIAKPEASQVANEEIVSPGGTD